MLEASMQSTGTAVQLAAMLPACGIPGCTERLYRKKALVLDLLGSQTPEADLLCIVPAGSRGV